MILVKEGKVAQRTGWAVGADGRILDMISGGGVGGGSGDLDWMYGWMNERTACGF